MKKFVAHLFCFLVLFCVPAFGQDDREKTGTGTTGSGGTTSGSSGSGGAPGNVRASVLKITGVSTERQFLTPADQQVSIMECLFANKDNAGNPGVNQIAIQEITVRVQTSGITSGTRNVFANTSVTVTGFGINGTTSTVTSPVIFEKGNDTFYRFSFVPPAIINPRVTGTISTVTDMLAPTLDAQRGAKIQPFIENIKCDDPWRNARVEFDQANPPQGGQYIIVNGIMDLNFGRSGPSTRTMKTNDTIAACFAVCSFGVVRPYTLVLTLSSTQPIPNPIALGNSARLVFPGDPSIAPSAVEVLSSSSVRITFSYPPALILTAGSPPNDEKDYFLVIDSTLLGLISCSLTVTPIERSFDDGTDTAAKLIPGVLFPVFYSFTADFIAPSLRVKN